MAEASKHALAATPKHCPQQATLFLGGSVASCGPVGDGCAYGSQKAGKKSGSKKKASAGKSTSRKKFGKKGGARKGGKRSSPGILKKAKKTIKAVLVGAAAGAAKGAVKGAAEAGKPSHRYR
jgi:hypothetical protein